MSVTADPAVRAVRARFETGDPDQAQAFIRAMYGDTTMRIRGPVEGFRLRHSKVAVGALSVATTSHTMAVEHHTEPLGGLVVLRILGGRVERESGGETLRAGPGDIFFLARPDEPHTIRWESLRAQVTWVDLGAVATVAGAGPGSRPRFDALVPVDPVQARHWRRTVDYVVASLCRDSPLSPLVVGSAVHMLAAATLMAFPNTCDEAPPRPGDGTRAAVHRAVSAMESRPDQDLGVSDLVEAARIDAGALTVAFRRHLGLTPGGYLNQIRLDQVHQELMYADPEEAAPVESVARRWGFLDLTRFATDYHAAYGCAPTETLRVE